jgi:hypothetical protein
MMRRLVPLFCLLLSARVPAQQDVSAAGAGTANRNAGPAGSAYNHAAAPAVQAAHVTGSIHVDGKLDEPAWGSAPPATAFRQVDPVDGAPPSEKTEVRVLIDDDAVYVGAHLFEKNPANVRPRLSRRDEAVDGDIFAVTFDSRHDHLTGYYFRVTAGGAIRDAFANGANPEDRDLSWDAVWDAAVSIDSTGWSAELRIPLSQLPYNRTQDPAWGIQFERYSWNKQENDVFAYTPKTEKSGINRFGHLTGLGQLPAPRRVELLPYVSSRAEYRQATPGDPFRGGSEYHASVGADLKYRVTSGLTLNGTVNPDFGQVEVDPAVVNLTAFETFFEEKRPFFVEGRDVFNFGQIRAFNSYGFPTMFFSRRIGRAPFLQLDGPDFNYVDEPQQTTIAGAAKLTGKTHGWSLGTLEALTTREQARFVDTLNVRRSQEVEPLTNYFVSRVRRELRAGSTTVGALVSAVNRDLNDDVLRADLRSGAYLGGLDLNHAWANRSWALDASFAASMVQGSEDAIAATQLSSARYYNRPDARSFEFDSTRTSLSGYAGQLALTRLAAKHWTGNVAYQVTSPGFEVNDIGFQTDADRHAFSTQLGYQETQPGGPFLNYNGAVFTNQTLNYDGDLVYNAVAGFFNGAFKNFSGVFVRADYNGPRYDDRLTRGGPVARLPKGVATQFQFFSDQRKRYTANVTLKVNRDGAGNWTRTYIASVAVQPTSALRVTLEPELDNIHSLAQYLTTVPDAGATQTFGARYVFATLDERQLAIVGRVDWTFTPRLSLQTFIQPLVFAGDFRDFKELRAPRTYDFNVYGRDVGSVTREPDGSVTIDPDANPASDDQFTLPQPNFNFRSLRGNAVLRWEYRPGSTLYFVWQQSRIDQDPVGDFRLGRDYRALFGAQPQNIFAVKATFWISR